MSEPRNNEPRFGPEELAFANGYGDGQTAERALRAAEVAALNATVEEKRSTIEELRERVTFHTRTCERLRAELAEAREMGERLEEKLRIERHYQQELQERRGEDLQTLERLRTQNGRYVHRLIVALKTLETGEKGMALPLRKRALAVAHSIRGVLQEAGYRREEINDMWKGSR